jgi:hypothetical protein
MFVDTLPSAILPTCPMLQIADGYFVKYFASAVSLLVYAGPLYFMDPRKRGNQGQLIAAYIRRWGLQLCKICKA